MSVFLFACVPSAFAGFPFFQSAPKINPEQYSQREQQVSEINERAKQLFNDGRFKEAQTLWENAIELMEMADPKRSAPSPLEESYDPGDTEVISDDYADDVTGDDVSGTYDSAVSLFKQRKYISSKKLFDQVEANTPDYKATRNYLAILQHKIKRQEQSLVGDQLEAGVRSRQEERAEWNRILEESEQELQKRLDEQAAPVYEEALQHYKSRKFKLAKDFFLEVRSILPDYKDTEKYLARVDYDIREEEQHQIKALHEKEVLARKKEQEEWQRILSESEQELQKKLLEQAAPIYEEALDSYKNRDFVSAKRRFQEVAKIVPEYKSTTKYLDRIDQDIQNEILVKQQKRAVELERRKREEELARKRDEERLRERQEKKEKARLAKFQAEIEARRKERDDWVKVLEESEQELKRKLTMQAKSIYDEAVRLYKKRQFEEAREEFNEVEHIYPDYQSTKKYLARIKQDIDEEKRNRFEEMDRELQRKIRKKELVERQQDENERLERMREEEKRLQVLQEKVLARKEQREEWEKALRATEEEYQRRLEDEAEFIYSNAVKSFKNKDWYRARDHFFEVAQIIPEYKDIEKYLSRTDVAIEKEERERKKALQDSIAKKKQNRKFLAIQEAREEEELAAAKEQEKLKRLENRAEAVYQYARSLYKQKYFAQAKEKFLETENMLADYKSTQKYLSRIDSDLERTQKEEQRKLQMEFARRIKEQRLTKMKQEKELEQKRKAEEKERLRELQLAADARKKEREEWTRAVKDIERTHQKRLEEQTEKVYQEALKYYKAGWFDQAKDAFKEADKAMPGYKSSQKYIELADQQIKNQEQLRRESEAKILAYKEKEQLLDMKSKMAEKQSQWVGPTADKFYKKGYKAYKKKDYKRAKEQFQQVEKIYPGYKATRNYLTKIAQAEELLRKRQEEEFKREARVQQQEQADEEGDLARARKAEDRQMLQELRDELAARQKQKQEFKESIERIEREHREKLKEQVKSIYDEAVQYYKAKDYERARMSFIDVDRMYPGYESTNKYLSRIGRKIGKQNRDTPTDRYDRGRSPSNVAAQVRQVDFGQREDLIQKTLQKMEGEYKNLDSRSIPLPDQGLMQKARVPEKKKIEEDVDWEQHIRQQREELKAERRQVQKEYEQKFTEFYKRAVGLYKSKSYQEAYHLFAQIQQLQPGYKKTSRYIDKIKTKLEKNQKSNKNVVVQLEENKTRLDVINEELNVFE